MSSYAFGILQDLASLYTSDWFDTCLVKTYKSYIGHCHFMEQVQLRHVQYLRNSFVELCSVDVQKSSKKAMVSIQHLAKILHHALQTKKEVLTCTLPLTSFVEIFWFCNQRLKTLSPLCFYVQEAVKNVCSWQYISCIDLWVSFISANIHDYDLHALIFTIIQIINGVTILFHGSRYLPLRVKCIQWLNDLSSASGIFIPVASLILDVLEYKIGEGGKHGKAFNLSASIKVRDYSLLGVCVCVCVCFLFNCHYYLFFILKLTHI